MRPGAVLADRQAVSRLTRTAIRHQPDRWDLLVPIGHNPAELRWFDGLREEFPFIREWCGRSWLDESSPPVPTWCVRRCRSPATTSWRGSPMHAASGTSSWAGCPTTWNGRARCMRGPRRSPRTTRCTPRWALSGQSAVHLTSKRPAPAGRRRSASLAGFGSRAAKSGRLSGGAGSRRRCASAARWRHGYRLIRGFSRSGQPRPFPAMRPGADYYVGAANGFPSETGRPLNCAAGGTGVQSGPR